jgi:hypothetical protein
MKYRTGICAALMVVAMMVFLAPSAFGSAKVCSTVGTGPACKAGHGNQYTGTISATVRAGTKLVSTLTNSAGNTIRTVECSGSVLSGKVNNSSTGTGEVTGMTFTGCTSAGCSEIKGLSLGLPWAATATTKTPGVEETKAIVEASNSFTEFTAVCLGIEAKCKYEATTNAVEFTTGEPAKGEVNKLPAIRVSGAEFICGVKEDLTGAYDVTTPTSLFIE